MINDIIKIKYVREGYLPNYPPHLTSNEEMVSGFINSDSSHMYDEYDIPDILKSLGGYFADNYISPMLDEYDLDNLSESDSKMIETMSNLVEYIQGQLQEAITLSSEQGEDLVTQDWIYSYMLGMVVGPLSDVRDKHDLLVLMNLDNIDDIFTPEAAASCYKISSRWIAKTYPNVDDTRRVPTIFGEPHVIKSLRLDDVSMKTEVS